MDVYRPDREELIKIRNGHYTYDYAVEWATKEIEAINALATSSESVLPRAPDLKKIENLCENAMQVFFQTQKLF
jgi:hypothetical protein